MRKVILSTIFIIAVAISTSAQTNREIIKVSESAALTRGIKTIPLINEFRITIDFNPDTEFLWITGEVSRDKMIISESIPLKDPIGTKIEIGKSYMLDNFFVGIEYKILGIKDNKVVRIWYRVVAKTLDPPEKSWI